MTIKGYEKDMKSLLEEEHSSITEHRKEEMLTQFMRNNKLSHQDIQSALAVVNKQASD